jgi:hypothetical protein
MQARYEAFKSVIGKTVLARMKWEANRAMLQQKKLNIHQFIVRGCLVLAGRLKQLFG